MANNRQMLQLSDLAFKALLQNSLITNFNDVQLEILMPYHLKQDIPPFLSSIADANPDAAKKFLDKWPELAVLAKGTVRTESGCIYENVSAIELACVMDDDELMRDVLLPTIQKLSLDMIKQAETQLSNKMAEIAKQQAKFKPYDFSEIVNAIAKDSSLVKTSQPSEATQSALTKFKKDFKPSNIKEGKSWIKKHLQEAFRVYAKNLDPWSGSQLRWYLIHVIGHMQTQVEKCFEQECSQGLDEIVNQKKSNARSVKIKNWINDIPISYRGSADSSLVLGRDFFVEIFYGSGCGVRGTLVHRRRARR